MPPRHRKGIADAVGTPEPDDSRNRSPEKDLLHRAYIRDSLAKPVTLTLSGPGGGSWILDASDKLITVTAADADVPTAAVIQSTSHEFTAWSTTRVPR